MGHVGVGGSCRVGWVTQGWGGVGHVGVGWVMQGWGGSYRGGWGGSCRVGVRWVIQGGVDLGVGWVM